MGKFVQVDFGLGAISKTTPLFQSTGKQLRRSALVVFKIGAKIHAGATADTQLPFVDILQQLCGPEYLRHKDLQIARFWVQGSGFKVQRSGFKVKV
jgi:hypothetical protein